MFIEFTGISSPYEPPTSPDLHIQTDKTSIEDSIKVMKIFDLLHLILYMQINDFYYK